MSEEIIGGNGKVKEEASSVIEMRIVMVVGKPMVVYFPLLNDKIATYGFLKVAEKVLDIHYQKSTEDRIQPVKGGIMNFVRRKN